MLLKYLIVENYQSGNFFAEREHYLPEVLLDTSYLVNFLSGSIENLIVYYNLIVNFHVSVANFDGAALAALTP